jgi:Fe-S cluster biogenesis protein NfuA
MSFTDNFNSCMSSSGLPTPSQVFDSVTDAVEFLEQLHTAWEAAGGDEEMTLAALAATAGAATGIDEGVLAILATAGAVTVAAYLGACAGCLVGAALSSGMTWQNLIASTTDSWTQNQLTVAANDQGIDPTVTATA